MMADAREWHRDRQLPIGDKWTERSARPVVQAVRSFLRGQWADADGREKLEEPQGQRAGPVLHWLLCLRLFTMKITHENQRNIR
jgi:hypothetical protein